MSEPDQEKDLEIDAPAAAPPPSPPVPHGLRLRVALPVAALVVAAFLAGIIWSEEFRALGHRLVEALAPAQEQKTAGPTQYYTCGMHPWVVLPKPGDCPICHMKLVPLDPAKFTGQMTINPVMTQNIGVRVAPVVTGPLTAAVRTVGSVDYDETLLSDLNLKVSGWVEKLYVNTIGQVVEKDQPLLDLYSPDLYAAQEEYLVSFKRLAAAPNPSDPAAVEMAAMNANLLAAARKRLEYFDISAEQVRQLEQSGKTAKTMTLRSPFRGTVIARNVVEGQKADAGMPLLRLADLSKVWIMVTIYEHQLPYVETGQKAVMSLPYLPGQTFEGKVAYVYPTVNPETRQARVRLEFANPGGLLKPGMFANVELRRTLATNRTLVPREAVIDTGERQVAFVSVGNGGFDPRQVKVGVEAEGGMVEILSGLAPGEMVVTSGEFLLDSESRLRESLAKMVGANLLAGPIVAGTTELASLPPEAEKALAAVLDGYFAIANQLSSDKADALAAPARQVAVNMDALIRIEIPDDPQFWRRHTEAAVVRGKALELVDAKDLGQAREEFADLGVALALLVRATGVPPTYGKVVLELHCPMYREKQGGTIWLQPAGPVRNPYYGQTMLECFDSQQALPVTGTKPVGRPATEPSKPPMPGM